MLMENYKQYSNDEIVRLVIKYLGEGLSPEEKGEFQAWMDTDPENRALVDRLQQEEEVAELYPVYKSFDTCRAWSRVHGKLFRRRNLIWRGVAAAVVVMGFLAYGLLNRQEPQPEIVVAERVLLPGNGQVSLTLGSGQKVELNRTNSRMIQVDSNLKIKEDSGLVAYQHIAGLAGKEKHTLTVGRGAEYRLKLDDGTLVHLNADSKLIYPVSFGADKREVILEGEAFFEVTKDSERPFVVHCPDYDVQVLGTSFNISAYPEEDFSHTTLVEGKVDVVRKGEACRLAPGYQAYEKSGNLEIRKVNPSAYVSWRDDRFGFDNESLEVVMRKLARWYDMEVFFANSDIRKIRFSGYLPKYSNVTDIFNILELTANVSFSLKGRVVTVMGKK